MRRGETGQNGTLWAWRSGGVHRADAGVEHADGAGEHALQVAARAPGGGTSAESCWHNWRAPKADAARAW